jgi:hypothetical protein
VGFTVSGIHCKWESAVSGNRSVVRSAASGIRWAHPRDKFLMSQLPPFSRPGTCTPGLTPPTSAQDWAHPSSLPLQAPPMSCSAAVQHRRARGCCRSALTVRPIPGCSRVPAYAVADPAYRPCRLARYLVPLLRRLFLASEVAEGAEQRTFVSRGVAGV